LKIHDAILWKQPPFSESVTAQWSKLPCQVYLPSGTPAPPIRRPFRAPERKEA
jgi:hypothetical protein